jgi:hypothetical protein
MNQLKEKAIAEAALDSFARYPPPLCHPGTCETLLEQITSWISDMNREHSLLWLYGSAGVGKSAVAQTIAESCQAKGWLGASFFFSRPNKRNDPHRVVPTLAHQLALTFVPYRSAVAQLLAEDHSVFEKTLRIQFDRLLIKLADQVHHNESPQAPRPSPILILLDGLDECDTDVAQQEFIELIGTLSFTCQQKNLRLVWIITSRPKWQITSRFEDLIATRVIRCSRMELSINTPEALTDVSRFLHDGFSHI